MKQQQNQYVLTNDQNIKYQELKKMVQENAPKLLRDELVAKYTDENHLIRLFVAREYKINDAFEQWKRWVEWRKLYKADDIKKEDIQSEINLKKAFWNGQDLLGNPCLVIKACRHFPGQSNPETLIRFFLYLLDEGVEKAEKSGTGKITVIWDREGVTSKNFDSSMFGIMKKIITLVQDNYAERLHQAFTLYPNFFVKSIMAVVRPFLSEKTKQKLVLCNEFKDLEPYFGKNFIINDQQQQLNIENQEEEEKKLQQILENIQE